jgi:hypothetical protein
MLPETMFPNGASGEIGSLKGCDAVSCEGDDGDLALSRNRRGA